MEYNLPYTRYVMQYYKDGHYHVLDTDNGDRPVCTGQYSECIKFIENRGETDERKNSKED